MRIKSDGVDVKHILLACLMLLPASGALGATSGSLPMDANGNYGIGTTAPASKLDLVGVGTTSATSNLILRNANKSAIVTVLDNGNVGIGTTGPRAPLNTYAPPTSGFVRQIMVGGTGNYPSLDLGTYADYDGYISTYGNDLRILAGRGITTENHNIHFFTAFNGGAAENNERMIIQYNGNVGIGTAAPVAMLHVGVGVKSGTADLSSNSALIKGNLEVDGKIYGDGTGITGITGTISGLSAGYLPKASSGTTLANSSIYDNGTNVGVGVASPGAKLEVNGNLLVGGTGDTWFTGNVGIGSTAPVARLQVAGDIKLSGVVLQNSGDLAEKIPLSRKARDAALRPGPGDVVVIAPDGGMAMAAEAASVMVAGVVSSKPAHVLRDDLPDAVAVALSGIVPCKVTDQNGMIVPGDLLVSSGKTGRAMKAGPGPVPGTVIGKALKAQAAPDDVIDMVVMLR